MDGGFCSLVCDKQVDTWNRQTLMKFIYSILYRIRFEGNRFHKFHIILFFSLIVIFHLCNGISVSDF